MKLLSIFELGLLPAVVCCVMNVGLVNCMNKSVHKNNGGFQDVMGEHHSNRSTGGFNQNSHQSRAIFSSSSSSSSSNSSSSRPSYDDRTATVVDAIPISEARDFYVPQEHKKQAALVGSGAVVGGGLVFAVLHYVLKSYTPQSRQILNSLSDEEKARINALLQETKQKLAGQLSAQEQLEVALVLKDKDGTSKKERLLSFLNKHKRLLPIVGLAVGAVVGLLLAKRGGDHGVLGHDHDGNDLDDDSDSDNDDRREFGGNRDRMTTSSATSTTTAGHKK